MASPWRKNGEVRACRILCGMNDRHDKDARLTEDIRLLGRLLGDTIRTYEGEAAFTQIEEIRKLAVASRKQEDTASRDALSRTLDALTTDQAVAVVRAWLRQRGNPTRTSRR